MAKAKKILSAETTKLEIIAESVQNPGSALGEAVGAIMETALNEYLKEHVQQFNCHLISKGRKNKKGKETKLLLYDNYGTQYNIDSVIANEAMQPLIILESKYIRYKKHNRDKGSWLCTAHNAVKRRYNSIRSSIAILAGNWSKSSIAMMKSQDINIFLIPFKTIVDLLAKHNIKFDWGEKDRHIATEAWGRFCQLSEDEWKAIGIEMIQEIKTALEAAIERTLDNTAEREVTKVTVEVYTNIGEMKRFEFDTIKDALDFLEDFTIKEMLVNENSFTLFDKPDEIIEDDEEDNHQTEIFS